MPEVPERFSVALAHQDSLRLRVKNIDFARNESLVREGKGNKDRGMIYTHVLNRGAGAFHAVRAVC
jgi:hypothetical protein